MGAAAALAALLAAATARQHNLYPLQPRDWGAVQLLPTGRDVGWSDVMALIGRAGDAAEVLQIIDRGILLLGDSTVRNLYIRMCALLNGGSEEFQSAEFEKLKIQSLLPDGGAKVARCPRLNGTGRPGGTFFPVWHAEFYQLESSKTALPAIAGASALQQLLPPGAEALESYDPKYVFWGLPVLHELWSPGRREPYAQACAARRTTSHYDAMAKRVAAVAAAANRTLVAGLAGHLCTCEAACCGSASCKFGECMLLYAHARNMSLRECGFVPAEDYMEARTKTTVETAEWWRQAVNSAVRLATSSCAAPSLARYTFDDAGVEYVNSLMATAVRNSRTPLLDMHAVTSGRCGTPVAGDGRHYRTELVQLQIAVLFEAYLELDGAAV